MDKDNKREQIQKKILEQGGTVVHVVGDDAEIQMLEEKGTFFDGSNSIVEGGKFGLCHNNSIELFLKNNGMRICTGYALVLDGNSEMWVKHSWCIDGEGVIHECTPIKRDKYFGAILDEKETEKFRREYDFEYDAKCKVEEQRKETLDNDALNMTSSTSSLDEEKVIKGWFKKVIEKIFSKKINKQYQLSETNISETEVADSSFIDELRKEVEEEGSLSVPAEVGEKETNEPQI